MDWSLHVKERFIEQLNERIELIRQNPELYPKSNLKIGLHKCVVSKQTSLYYRHDSKTVTVLTIFDNRQDPDKLSSEIEE